MGSWQPEGFGNDDALDWLTELQGAEDIAPLSEAFGRVLSNEGYLELTDCCVAIAAAEVVAAMRNRPSPESPAEIERYIERVGRVGSEPLVASALKSVQLVGAASELQELWDESEHGDEWRSALADLVLRLTGHPNSRQP